MFSRVFGSRRPPRETLFAAPERVRHRTDSLDAKNGGGTGRRILSGVLLGAVGITGFAPTIQQVSAVWEGRDEYVPGGGR